MSEEVDTAAVLHAFGADTARAIKRKETEAKDTLLFAKVYGEAQRLQGIVAQLTREEHILNGNMSGVADQYNLVTQKLVEMNEQLGNNERLLDEVRKNAQARIAEEMDVWQTQQLQTRVQELDGLTAERRLELHLINEALLVVQGEVQSTEMEHARLQAAVEILRQTRLDLVGEIAAAV